MLQRVIAMQARQRKNWTGLQQEESNRCAKILGDGNPTIRMDTVTCKTTGTFLEENGKKIHFILTYFL
jgi:hypothetical protein